MNQTQQQAMVAQEMFLTQVQPLQDYKAMTEETASVTQANRMPPVAVAEQVKLEQTEPHHL